MEACQQYRQRRRRPRPLSSTPHLHLLERARPRPSRRHLLLPSPAPASLPRLPPSFRLPPSLPPTALPATASFLPRAFNAARCSSLSLSLSLSPTLGSLKRATRVKEEERVLCLLCWAVESFSWHLTLKGGREKGRRARARERERAFAFVICLTERAR